MAHLANIKRRQIEVFCVVMQDWEDFVDVDDGMLNTNLCTFYMELSQLLYVKNNSEKQANCLICFFLNRNPTN